MSTLSYDYADALVAVGPLSPERDPHGYDLCAEHTNSLALPRGWRALRYTEPTVPVDESIAPGPRSDDLPRDPSRA